MGRIRKTTGQLVALVALVALLACSNPLATPGIESIEPAQAEAGESKEVMIHGEDFLYEITNNLESGKTIVDGEFRVVLRREGDQAPVELQDVRYVDNSTLLGIVPNATPAGTYTAQAIGPHGPGIEKSGAFEVKSLADAPFGTPVLVPGLSSTTFDDDDPTPTGDMLEVYFKSNRGPNLDIYGAMRASVDDAWSAVARIDELSSDSTDNTPDVSFDGLTMYPSSNREGDIDQFRSTRPSRMDSWSIPVRVVELSSGDPDFSVTTDGPALQLVMNRSVAGNSQLFSAERNDVVDLWSIPVPIDVLNTETFQGDAVLDYSGLRWLYCTVEADPVRGREIYVAERDRVNNPFSPGAPLSVVNSDRDEGTRGSHRTSKSCFSRERVLMGAWISSWRLGRSRHSLRCENSKNCGLPMCHLALPLRDAGCTDFALLEPRGDSCFAGGGQRAHGAV